MKKKKKKKEDILPFVSAEAAEKFKRNSPRNAAKHMLALHPVIPRPSILKTRTHNLVVLRTLLTTQHIGTAAERESRLNFPQLLPLQPSAERS